MSRCKACDNVLDEKEIIWYEDTGEHEDMCNNCKQIIRDMDDEYSIDFGSEDTFSDIIPTNYSDYEE